MEVWDADISTPDFIGQRTLLTNVLLPFIPQIHSLVLQPRNKNLGKLLKKSNEEKLGTLTVKTQYIERKMIGKCLAPELVKNYKDACEMYTVMVRMFISEQYVFLCRNNLFLLIIGPQKSR